MEELEVKLENVEDIDNFNDLNNLNDLDLLEITDFDSPEIIKWKAKENFKLIEEYKNDIKELKRKEEERRELRFKEFKKKSSKAQVCAGDGKQRRENDYYSTPKEALDSLFEKITIDKNDTILEPCCAEGAISKYLELLRLNVISTELNEFSQVTKDYGKTFAPVKNYGNTGIDFLSLDIDKFLTNNGYSYQNDGYVDVICTNPPFSHDIEFILKSFQVARKRVIMLLKLNFLSTQIRKNLLWGNYAEIDIDKLIKEEPKKYSKYKKYFMNEPCKIWKAKNIFVIPYRLLFDGYNYSTPLEFIWVEWECNYTGNTNIDWFNNRKEENNKKRDKLLIKNKYLNILDK